MNEKIEKLLTLKINELDFIKDPYSIIPDLT